MSERVLDTFPATPSPLFRAMFGEKWFYVLYFQEPGVAEAEFEADIPRTMRTILAGVPGSDTTAVAVRAKKKGDKFLRGGLTAHPDFDDTPLEDENGDGNKGNDGNLWHSHWVVLVKDASCPGGLKVRDIPEGTRPKLPKTWPGLPILIDSPGFKPALRGQVVEVRIPEEAATFPAQFNYDGVTAALKVNANLHDPLLCVTGTFDVTSGDLSLPGRVLR